MVLSVLVKVFRILNLDMDPDHLQIYLTVSFLKLGLPSQKFYKNLFADFWRIVQTERQTERENNTDENMCFAAVTNIECTV